MATTITGFYRVHGFDHRVRCVTDAAPDQYGRPLTVWQDGTRVFAGHQIAGEVLPLNESGSALGGSMVRSEQAEIAACAEWLAGRDDVPLVLAVEC